MVNQLKKGLKQTLIFDKIDGDLIEIAFWAKFASNKQSAAERQTIRGFSQLLPTNRISYFLCVFLGKINCKTNIGSQTLHMMGVQGCDLLENDWFRYHGTADISSC